MNPLLYQLSYLAEGPTAGQLSARKSTTPAVQGKRVRLCKETPGHKPSSTNLWREVEVWNFSSVCLSNVSEGGNSAPSPHFDVTFPNGLALGEGAGKSPPKLGGAHTFLSSYQRWNIHLSGNYLQFPVHISGSPSVASVPEDEMGGLDKSVPGLMFHRPDMPSPRVKVLTTICRSIGSVGDLRRFTMVRRWIGLPAVAGAVVVLCAGGYLLAEDKAPAAKPKAAATDKAGKPDGEKPAAAKKPVDPFAVPEGTDAKVLGMFLSRLQRVAPKTRTPEGIVEHLNKLEKVADELLSRELEDSLIEQAVGMKIQILSLYPQFEVEGADERRAEFLAKAAEDPRPIVSNLAKQFLKMERVQKIGELKKEERAALIEELAKDIQEGELTSEEVEFAMLAGNTLAEIGDTEEAVAALNLFAKYVEATGTPNAEKVISSMQGTARKLSLPGNPIEIAGTKIDGTEFKIEELKGKVVLIDFWATWCGPCLAELPNVMEQYELYHDKGFEVVGISLDEDRAALEEFLAEKKLPWIQLHQNDGAGWGNNNAARYAIQGIPACFLIDQEGKVVSLECRGEVLPAMLEKLLGPVEKKPAEAEEQPEKPKKSE